jgi:hypothetical protein
MNTGVWCPEMSRLTPAAPRAIGRMTVPTPRAKTNVIDTSARRRWKLEAKYAGSITEMQHGAKSATAPARKLVRSVPPTSRSCT